MLKERNRVGCAVVRQGLGGVHKHTGVAGGIVGRSCFMFCPCEPVAPKCEEFIHGQLLSRRGVNDRDIRVVCALLLVPVGRRRGQIQKLIQQVCRGLCR